MSKESQLQFLNKLMEEVSEDKVKDYRVDYANKQEGNLFIGRGVLRKGFRYMH